jgi:threonine dehydrogenase-like Zn-dependent dehydrogenase
MLKDSMKASFYRGNRTFETGSVPMPQPADGEALLRVRQVGICGTDLHIFQGTWITACRAAGSSATRPLPRS